MFEYLSIQFVIVSFLVGISITHSALQLKNESLRFRIVTWNVGNSLPYCDTFKELVRGSSPDDRPIDLIVFGFQEVSSQPGGAQAFHSALKKCLKNEKYTGVVADFVGSYIAQPIWLFVYALNTVLNEHRINLLRLGKEKTLKVKKDKHFESFIGYKGILATRLEIDQVVNMTFANMHLPSGEGNIGKRCKLLSKFLYTYEQLKVNDKYLFVFGDQNWRISSSLSIENILRAIDKKDYQTILNHDELFQMIHKKSQMDTSYCLGTLTENPIQFPPTYKFVKDSDQYQTYKNNEERRPSYTDRILFSHTDQNLGILRYSSMPTIRDSDHRPVFMDAIINTKSSKKSPRCLEDMLSIKC